MGRLDGKVALVTGAASGIGEGTARRFVQEGARLVVADLQEEPGREVAKSLGADAHFVRTDVTRELDIAAAVDAAVAEFGQLDIMVNNAGIVGAIGSIVETSAEDFDATMSVLARAVFLGMKHAGRVMLPRRSGSIVSVASTAGVVGGLGPHTYTMAKHGVVGLTKSVANEFAAHGVRVNAVAPGNTVTAMTSAVVTGDPSNVEDTRQALEGMSPLGIAGVPEDIAAAILYLASDDARYVSGHTLVVDAGQTSGGPPAAFHSARVGLIREAGKRGTRTD